MLKPVGRGELPHDTLSDMWHQIVAIISHHQSVDVINRNRAEFCVVCACSPECSLYTVKQKKNALWVLPVLPRNQQIRGGIKYLSQCQCLHFSSKYSQNKTEWCYEEKSARSTLVQKK